VQPSCRLTQRGPARFSCLAAPDVFAANPGGVRTLVIAFACGLAAALGATRPAAGAAPAIPTARAVSGAPQSAWGYASTASTTYVAEFARPLVVRLEGGRAADVAVRFWCATPGCTLPPSDQPNDVSRFDPRSYDVKVEHGRAELQVTLGVPSPGPYVMLAAPVVNGKLRPARAARFVLTVR